MASIRDTLHTSFLLSLYVLRKFTPSIPEVEDSHGPNNAVQQHPRSVRKIQKPIAVGVWHELVDFFHRRFEYLWRVADTALHRSPSHQQTGSASALLSPLYRDVYGIIIIQAHPRAHVRCQDSDLSQSRHDLRKRFTQRNSAVTTPAGCLYSSDSSSCLPSLLSRFCRC